MNTETHTNDQAALAAYRERSTELIATATRTLTDAVRLRRPDGTADDFPDLLATVIANVTANMGGAARLIEGRPGSWEAGHVYSFARAALSDDTGEILRRRTEPTILTLNINQLIDDEWPHKTKARQEVEDALYNKFDELGDESDEAVEALEDAVERNYAHYQRAYEGYAIAFAEHATAAAKQLLHGDHDDPGNTAVKTTLIMTDAALPDLAAIRTEPIPDDAIRLVIIAVTNPDAVWWGDGVILNTSWGDGPVTETLWEKTIETTPSVSDMLAATANGDELTNGHHPGATTSGDELTDGDHAEPTS